jgi:ribosomal protein S18 acetylase RimI-like enzyme
MVSSEARGKGIAGLMCEHSQQTAIALGFEAMQFNSVVSTNDVAVRLWQKLGFAIVGTIPNAYKHAELGLVDSYVMYKWLKA